MIAFFPPHPRTHFSRAAGALRALFPPALGRKFTTVRLRVTVLWETSGRGPTASSQPPPPEPQPQHKSPPTSFSLDPTTLARASFLPFRRIQTPSRSPTRAGRHLGWPPRPPVSRSPFPPKPFNPVAFVRGASPPTVPNPPFQLFAVLPSPYLKTHTPPPPRAGLRFYHRRMVHPSFTKFAVTPRLGVNGPDREFLFFSSFCSHEERS